jgi:hypothetical protein
MYVPIIPLVAILSPVTPFIGPPGAASLPPITDVEVVSTLYAEPVSASPLTRVEVHYGPESTQVVAFDAEDQVAAEIVVQIVDEGPHSDRRELSRRYPRYDRGQRQR